MFNFTTITQVKNKIAFKNRPPNFAKSSYYFDIDFKIGLWKKKL